MTAGARSQGEPSPRRRAAFFAVMLLIPLSVLLVATEVYLRIALAQRLRAVEEMAALFETHFRWDPEIGALHAPDARTVLVWDEAPAGRVTLRTNQLGFREDAATESAQTATRVIVFGDSHTDGFVDNDKSFVNVAERLLRDEGLEVEIINAGTSTHSLYAEYLHFRRHLDLAPDIAIFAFYTGNDYEEILSPERAHVAFEEGEPHGRPAGETSRLPDAYVRLEQIIREQNPGPILVLGRLRQWLGPGQQDPIPRERSVAVFAQSLSQAALFTRHPPLLTLASRANAHVVDLIVRLARERGIAVGFLVLPTKYQIERDADVESFEVIERLHRLDPADPMDARIRADFVALLARAGVDHVDLHDALAAHRARTGETLYYRSDHHLNESGNAAIGRLLADYLRPRLAAAAGER